MNKKQVKQFIDLCKIRTMNQNSNLNKFILITENEKVYLTGTNGIMILQLKVDENNNKDYDNKFISLESFQEWYKKATSKDQLNIQTLETMLQDLDHNYPVSSIKKFLQKKENEKMEVISFNPKLLMLFENLLLKDDSLRLNFKGKFKPIEISSITQNIKGLLMPYRIN